MMLAMDRTTWVLDPLSRTECMRLLASVPIGRIVYTRQALPAVELVNFTIADGDIIIRTDASGKLSAAANGTVVAFEADSVDLPRQAGWSVTVVGRSRAVTEGEEARRLERVGLSAWAPGRRDCFIVITPEIVNGRRLGPQDEEAPA
jgi:hypothetical protein